jgi:hypothetical protein
MFHRKIITVMIVLSFALGAWAQNSPPHQHVIAATTVIDGFKNPEQIPDETALRLWLVNVSVGPNATDEERRIQGLKLSKLQFTHPADHLALIPVLAEFKANYTSLINRYNEQQQAAWARGRVTLGQQQSDRKLFLQQVDDLVATTRTAISKQLSPTGMTTIAAHVWTEKKSMRLYTSEAQ